MKTVKLNTAIVGSGAAGFNCAVRLKQLGVDSVAIITEGVNMGTSRNTGSDKQTYYKLGLGGGAPDSVHKMAEDLFSYGSVDGDNALCEAALSARSFMHLCEIGVPFPTNRYGEYVGYKTDHDPYARATSVGPLTSKEMTETLQKEAQNHNVEIYDNKLVISIIKNGSKAIGLLAMDTNDGEFILFNCQSTVFATGGPAGMYEDSVYPTSQCGSSGVMLEAGAKGQNLTEWQYGLASVSPRWNVSGTYMQVLPRLISVDSKGNEHEFLQDYFEDKNECLSMIFLKGYQWPFDSRKVMTGSSVIDLLVYREKVIKGNRVFLDYTKNPFGNEIEFDKLSSDAKDYLSRAGACFGTPIERLLHMNAPAVELYRSKGVDLTCDMLEISLSAQHNNGGIAVDMWWSSSVERLFVVGEAAGTHGVYRPGGSALNAGQVGSLRAAQYIAHRCQGKNNIFDADKAVAEATLLRSKLLENKNNIKSELQKARTRMSNYGGAIRNAEKTEKALNEVKRQLAEFESNVGVGGDTKLLADAFRLRDTLISQHAYLFAMLDYAKKYKTRGSALYTDKNGKLRDGLDELFRFSEDNGESNGIIQEVAYKNGELSVSYRPVRPLPESGGFFENVWKEFRENGNVY